MPRMADLIGPAIDELLKHNPEAAKFIAEGRWGDVIAGIKAQGALIRRRLVSEIEATRLGHAKGQALHELAESEYGVLLNPEPRTAIGEVALSRTVTNASADPAGAFTLGLIPKGFRFRRPARPDGFPVLEEAEYVATQDVPLGDGTGNLPGYTTPVGGQHQHTEPIFVPIEATRTGPHANTPTIEGQGLPGEALDKLPDPTLVLDSLTAAGGGAELGEEDGDYIRDLCLHTYKARLGPTWSALIAGSLSNERVRHLAMVKHAYVDIPAGNEVLHYLRGDTMLFVADGSWAGSAALAASVGKTLKDDHWLGWGARVGTSTVRNKLVVVKANVLLKRDRKVDIPALRERIEYFLNNYFNHRFNWWSWRLQAVGGLIAGSHPHIQTCTDVEIVDEAGAALVEPPEELTISSLDDITNGIVHYWPKAYDLSFV